MSEPRVSSGVSARTGVSGVARPCSSSVAATGAPPLRRVCREPVTFAPCAISPPSSPARSNWPAEVVSGVPEGDDLVSVYMRSLAGAAILRLLFPRMVGKRGPKSSFPDDPRPKSYLIPLERGEPAGWHHPG